MKKCRTSNEPRALHAVRPLLRVQDQHLTYVIFPQAFDCLSF
jgi:hypothetical protein